MTTPLLYCMLDSILGYYLPPATIDEGNLWDPNTPHVYRLDKDTNTWEPDEAGAHMDPPKDPFDSGKYFQNPEDEDDNEGEEWKELL